MANGVPVEHQTYSQTQSLAHQETIRIAKRVMDVTLCVIALPLLLPLMIICAVIIVIDSPGPALFVQERVGLRGRRFHMYKFRTLRHRFDDSGHRTFMKAFVRGEIGSYADDDSRQAFIEAFVNKPGRDGEHGQIYKPIQAAQVTSVGHILRKTSLDELPQIINILKGEMSLVGPRPNVSWEVEEYRPWHFRRLEALPGVTGLAQVRGRSCISFNDIVKYDIEYVENQSLTLDIKILWQTAQLIMSGKGAG